MKLLFSQSDLEKEERCPFCGKVGKPELQLQYGIPSMSTCAHCGKILKMYGFAGYILSAWRKIFPPRPVN